MTHLFFPKDFIERAKLHVFNFSRFSALCVTSSHVSIPSIFDLHRLTIFLKVISLPSWMLFRQLILVLFS